MNRRNLAKTLVLYGLLLGLVSCSQVPITGRKQLNIVPDSMMLSMSFQTYGEFLQENKLSSNSAQTAQVKQVGQRIRRAVEQYCAETNNADQLKGYQWDFNLIEDEAVNAWAMPGGKVVVYTGLMPVAQNDSGLAVVMGHEIAHAFGRHGHERMSQALLVEMGGAGLSVAMRNSPTQTRNLFLRAYGAGTQYGVLLPYSRMQESEADHLGLIFMALAGYDPHEAVSFWQRMSALKGGQQVPEFLSTHPADEKRIKNIQELIPSAMRYYRPGAD